MKFKLSPTVKISLAVLFFAFAVMLMTREGGSSWSSHYAGGKAFPSLRVDAVAEMRIVAGKAETTLLRQGAGWIVKERDGHPADARKIAKTLSALASVKSARQLEALSEKEVRELGIAPETPAGPTLSLYDDKGAKTAELVLGHGHFVGGIRPNNPYEQPDARYCFAFAANGKGSAFLTSSLFDWLDPRPGNWLEAPAVDMTEALELSVSASKSGGWSVSRKSSKEPFLFNPPLKGEPVSNEIVQILSAISHPQIIDLAPEELSDIRLAETVTVSASFSDGSKAEYLFGRGQNRVIMKASVPKRPAKWIYEVNPEIMRFLVQAPPAEPGK